MKKLLSVFIFALAGCAGAGTQPLVVSPGGLGDVAPAHSRADRLIYSSTETYLDQVNFYSYRTGKLEGTITDGLSEPQGICADAKGNVWIANTGTSQLLEFAHGATTHSGSLSDTGEYPTDCAVSKNGDVAASNIESVSGGPGNVVIFAGGKEPGIAVTCSNLQRYYFSTYDPKGNLWVDGETSSYGFGLCEIRAGASNGTPITLNSLVGFAGGVQWDGKYVAVMDQDAASIYRYAISGSTGTLVGVVALGQLTGDDVVAFIMNGRNSVVAWTVTTTTHGLRFWHYPKGGNPYKQLAGITGTDIAISPPKKL